MEFNTIKAKVVEQDISTIIGGSELPISTLYYMMKSLTKDLELLMIQQARAEQEKINELPDENVVQEEEIK